MKKYFLIIPFLIIILIIFFLTKKTSLNYCNTLPKVIEISFHTIPKGREEEFKEKLIFLKKEKFSPILITDLYNFKINNKSLPANPVLIIFEDGDYSWYKTAYPVLKELDLKTNFALTTNFVNGLLPWNKIREMMSFRNFNGERMFTLLSHSITHDNNLFHEDDKQLNEKAKFNLKLNFLYELFYSKKIIEDKTNEQVLFFSPPYGGLDGFTEKDLILRKTVKDVGYKAIISAGKFIIPDKYTSDAIRINADLSKEKFEKELLNLKEPICQ